MFFEGDISCYFVLSGGKNRDENNNDDSLLLELIISEFFKLHLTCDRTNYRLRIGESTFCVAAEQRMIKFLFQQKKSMFRRENRLCRINKFSLMVRGFM